MFIFGSSSLDTLGNTSNWTDSLARRLKIRPVIKRKIMD